MFIERREPTNIFPIQKEIIRNFTYLKYVMAFFPPKEGGKKML